MPGLLAQLQSLDLGRDGLALAWLGQAGFAIQTAAGGLVLVDAYLSNMCETALGGGVGSKRMIPPPLRAEQINRGLMISTHAHQDHHDEESLELIARRSREVRFAGPAACTGSLRALGIPAERMTLLEPGRRYDFDEGTVWAVDADHGDAMPDALGVVLEVNGIRVYHTGDTAFRPDRLRAAFDMKPDIILPCINGTYGNMNALEAARAAAMAGAHHAIPCHYWFFVAQNTNPLGTPAAFLDACREHAPHVQPLILGVAECFVYRRGCGT